LASSPVDYWRRWHISLSIWLRDYLYTPLAMAYRHHPYLNLAITFVLAGLWHGPRWTYVVFGAYWAILMVVTQFGIDRLPRKASRRIFAMPVVRVAQTIGTFYLVLIGMVFFRAETLAQAFDVLRVMHLGGGTAAAVDYATVVRFALVIAAIVGTHLLDYWVLRKPQQIESGWLIWPLIVIQFTFAMSLGARAQAFIYFQF
jgi:alginate O-acetyltransferase complex protein AlgI